MSANDKIKNLVDLQKPILFFFFYNKNYSKNNQENCIKHSLLLKLMIRILDLPVY